MSLVPFRHLATARLKLPKEFRVKDRPMSIQQLLAVIGSSKVDLIADLYVSRPVPNEVGEPGLIFRQQEGTASLNQWRINPIA